MRFVAAAALLLVVATGLGAQERAAGFAPSLPRDVGDVSRWEIVTGDFDVPQMRGSYRFYVNPSRQAMYQLMRYRVELLRQRSDAYQRASGERVAFVRHPGTRERMLIWTRAATEGGPSWRLVVADTDEYKIELSVLMGVLALHRAVRAGEAR